MEIVSVDEMSADEDQRELFPTFENILDEFKNKKFLGASKSSKKDQEEGFAVAVPGLSPCPWCAANMIEIEETYKAVCVKNPLHKVIWLPWGG